MEIKPAMNREDAESAAAGWIARRERDDWNETDERALEAWIMANMNHRAAWLRLNAAWQQTARLRALKTTVPPGIVPAPHEMHLPFFEPAGEPKAPNARRSKRRIGLKAYASAAGVVLAVMTAGALHFLPGGAAYSTEVGAMHSVPLPDGSRVTLNTRTDIRVTLTDSERRVHLDQGEAYFEVARDPRRPFVVEAGGRKIVAVGTQFSVRREAGDVRVLVTEGAVRVDEAALLTAGAVARAAVDGVFVQQKAPVEVEQALSWRSGYLVFDRTPLAEAVAEFNRYNQRQVRIEDPALTAVPVGGSFRATNVKAFLRLIERDLPLQVIESGQEMVLRGRPPAP